MAVKKTKKGGRGKTTEGNVTRERGSEEAGKGDDDVAESQTKQNETIEESPGGRKEEEEKKRERERRRKQMEDEEENEAKERTRKLRAHSSLPASKWAGICSHGNGKGNRCERWLFRDETIVSYKRAREAGRG